MFRYLTVALFLESFVLVLAIENREYEPHMLGMPPNNHGIEPTILTDKEIKVFQGNILTEIPILSTEWSVSLNLRIVSVASNGRNLMRFFSLHSLHNQVGEHTPTINVIPDKKMKICSAVNGVFAYCHTHGPINLNQTYHVEIHQRYVANGQYRYFNIIDGVEVHSVVNTDARQFYTVRVMASQNLNGADAYVSNFRYVNFL